MLGVIPLGYLNWWSLKKGFCLQFLIRIMYVKCFIKTRLCISLVFYTPNIKEISVTFCFILTRCHWGDDTEKIIKMAQTPVTVLL